MPIYKHECPEHGEVKIECRMSEACEIKPCPICQKDSKRIYEIGAIHWKCDGLYGGSGDKG